MKEQIEKTKRFISKHRLPLNENLTVCKADATTSSYLKEIAFELIEAASFVESRLHHNSDPRLLRVHLMIEELGEIVLGLANCDEVETLDGLSDLIFVAIGTGLAFDLPFIEGLDEVCDSNLTKKISDQRMRDKGPDYRSPNMKRVLSLYRGILVRAQRTSCIKDGRTWTTCVHVKRRWHEELKSWWVYVTRGGVTGYESMRVDRVSDMCDNGWCACAGTKNKWDKLHVSAEEMQKVSQWLSQ